MLDRVVQLRRRRAKEAKATAERADDGPDGEGQRIEALERRLNHLEALVEALQDAVHRESVHRGEQIQGLEEKTEPGEMTRALSRDARERGI